MRSPSVGRDERDREAVERFRNRGKFVAFTDPREQHDREHKAESPGDPEYNRFDKVVTVLDIKQGDTEDRAVRRDQRKVNAERFIQRRACL